ncbi:MAG: TonB family protein [Proteobacteria bacterium]|nr:TonB family protein [Pseudomonadota bacterium]
MAGLGQSDAAELEDPASNPELRAAVERYKQAFEDKDAKAALAAAEESLQLGKRFARHDDARMAEIYINYGMAHILAGEYWAATRSLHKGIEWLEKLNGKHHKSLIDPLKALAIAYRGDERKTDNTIIYLERVLQIVTMTWGKADVLYAEANLSLGEAFYSSFRMKKRAPRYLQEAYDTYQRINGGPAFETGLAAFILGKSAMERGKHDAAEEHFLDALHLIKETKPGHEIQFRTHGYLIALYVDRGNSDKADAQCRAVSLLRPQDGVDGYRPLYKKMPKYPLVAARESAEGYVLVEFTVTTSGRVEDIEVVESGGSRPKAFARNAVKAVKYFRYAPAMKDGKFVETQGVRNLISYIMAK